MDNVPTLLRSSFYTKSFIMVFIVVVTFLAFDFWTVKNVSGRLLVGLRWWNKVRCDNDKSIVHTIAQSRNQYPAMSLSQHPGFVGMGTSPDGVTCTGLYIHYLHWPVHSSRDMVMAGPLRWLTVHGLLCGIAGC